MNTQDVSLGPVVVKRFRSYERGEHRREWLSLRLLDHFSPGLTPRPLSADLDAHLPVITMTRLPGDPLGDRPLPQATVAAIAIALDRLHSAVPVRIAEQVAPSHGHAHRNLGRLRDLLDAHPGTPDDPTMTAAVAAARRWLRSAEATSATDLDAVPSVYGREDHNLANFLADGDAGGHGLTLVDFEDAGRSDRATETAALVEHHASRGTPDAGWQPLLDAVDDQARLRAARRYHASFWVVLMLPGQRGHDRNPAPVRRAQAQRLLTLLE